MHNSVEFESDLFRPFLPDEAQVNPGVYGAELAYWLARELAQHDIFTSYPNYEDWGWFIEYTSPDEDEFWLCCGNQVGSDNKWLCFVDAKSKGFLNRSKPPIDKAKPLLDAMSSLLEENSNISKINWFTEELP